MKVRIGVGTGSGPMSGDVLATLVEDLEARRFDSLWWADVLTVPGDDPLAAMAFAAGRVAHLKIGTTMVLPGRRPVRLAKQLATLDQLSGGRLLVTFVLGLRLPAELEALGVAAGDRGRAVEETLPLLRRLWAEDDVHHEGACWSLRGVTVEPKPRQRPLEAWLGGTAPAAQRRAGALADGWLPALCTPAEAEAGRRVVEEAAAAAGRRVDPEHFGVSIGYTLGEPPADLLRRVMVRRAGAGSPDATDAEVQDLVPNGIDQLRSLIGRFTDAGFSKFVVRPVVPPRSWARELDILAQGLLDLQT